jgi:apolipoprotein N-acyltransferase
MNKLFTEWKLLVIISSVLTFLNICKVEFLFSWICFVPLFICIINSKQKQSFKAGFLFGLVFSIPCFFWMIPGAERFTGNSFIYGLLIWILFAAFFSVFYGIILFCFSFLKNKNKNPAAVVLNSFLIAALFTIFESLLTNISIDFPWFAVYSGNGLAANIYSIQPVSIFGISFLTFIVVFVNYLFAYYIKIKEWRNLYLPVIIIALYLTGGFFLLQNFESKAKSGELIKVAILAENIPPEMKWNENTGNYLVKRLLDLNLSAVALKPNIALWSESAIPWTYKKDDDLIKEVLSITEPAHMTHILGINTADRDNIIFNSAYCILPNGEVAGRYDKQYLLSFVEKPLGGILMPFFSSAGFSVISDPQHAAPLVTPYGKAGILICNEAAIPEAAANMVKNGAQFLFNISNDGWFNDTYIVRLHFYYARLRAVESRKDLVINCNNGYSGLIKASGEIIGQVRSEDPFVKMVSVQPNNIMSTASVFPNLFIYCCAFYLLMFTIFNFINLNKSKDK